MEVGETSRLLNSADEGVEVAAVAGEPLGVIHQEHPVQQSRGGIVGRDSTKGFMPSDFTIYAVFHASHGATLPRAGAQVGGGRGSAVNSSHMKCQGAVVALQRRGVGCGNSGSGQNGVLGVVVDGAVHVADIIRQDPHLEAPRSRHTSWRTRWSSTEEQWGGFRNWWGGRMPLVTKRGW